MLHLPLLVLLQTFKYTLTTRPYVTYYWKTTAVTDKGFDYWGHGPIYIPGLQKIYPMSTRSLDVFPPWLTSGGTDKTTQTTIAFEKTSHAESTTVPTEATTVTKLTTNIINTAAVEEGPTDPFSAFLRKLLRNLSVKSLPELPVLFEPFTQFVTQLITDGKLKSFDNLVVLYLKKMIDAINDLILAPDRLRTQCYQAYSMLTNRKTALDNDTNALLDFLDNLYDEAEEEDMQKVLQVAMGFPNNNATADEIAYGFVYLVFVKPMNRVNGTIKGNTLVSMLTAAIAKRESSARRLFKSPDRVHTSLNRTYERIKRNDGRKRFTAANYNKIRYNVDNINEFVESFNFSSFESSESDYDIREFYSEIEKIEGEFTSRNIKTTAKIKINQKRTGPMKLKAKEEYLRQSYVPSDDEDLQKSIQELIENYEKMKNVFSSKVSTNFRGKDYTILVPRNPFSTKIIKKKIPYDSFIDTTKNKHKRTQYTFFTDERPYSVYTKPSRESNRDVTKSIIKKRKPHDSLTLSTRKKYLKTQNTMMTDDKPHSVTKHSKQSGREIKKGQVKKKNNNGEKLSLILSALFDKIPELNLNHGPLINQSKAVAQNRFHVKRGPDTATTKERLHTTQVFRTTKPIQINNKGPKHLSEIEIPSSMVNILSKEKPEASPNKYKTVTPHAKIDSQNISIKGETKKESANESDDDSAAYGTSSSETSEENNDEEEDTDTNEPTEPNKSRHELKNIKPQDHLKILDINRQKIGKHGIDSSRDEKRKYDDLKRKYNILKQILAQKIDPKKLSATSIENLNIKQYANIERKNNEEVDINFSGDQYEKKTTTLGKIGINEINLFLDDYGGKTDFRNNIQQKIRQYELTEGYHNNIETMDMSRFFDDIGFRKFFPRNTTITGYSGILSTTEFNVGEIELKRNIDDAIRHMDFKNYNGSRRKDDDISPIVGQDSPETDVEAVLKTNIYKAVKKLL